MAGEQLFRDLDPHQDDVAVGARDAAADPRDADPVVFVLADPALDRARREVPRDGEIRVRHEAKLLAVPAGHGS